MGIGDWIPAGGKGHALLEVTGNVGNAKGGRMFRRRRFNRFSRGGARNTKFANYRTRKSNKWWFTYIGEGGAEDPIQWDFSLGNNNYNSPQVVVSIEGQNTQGNTDNARGSNEQFVRWIGRDGFISLTYDDPEADDGTPADPETLALPYITVLYAWFKFKQDFAQTLPNNIVSQFGMQVGQNMGVMLQRKDIIRWGTVDVFRPSNRTETVSSGVFSYANQGNGANRLRSFIPFPRFPRAGFRVEPNDIIMCIVQPCDSRTFGSLDGSSTMRGMRLTAMPLFRMLMAE